MTKNLRIVTTVILVLAMTFICCACGGKQELVDMSTSVNGEYAAIIWEGKTYVPFCAVSKNDCGAQIGYVDGNTDDKVCQYKDYSTEEWVANYIAVDGGAMLLKEENVTDIPDGLESEYKWNK